MYRNSTSWANLFENFCRLHLIHYFLHCWHDTTDSECMPVSFADIRRDNHSSFFMSLPQITNIQMKVVVSYADFIIHFLLCRSINVHAIWLHAAKFLPECLMRLAKTPSLLEKRNRRFTMEKLQQNGTLISSSSSPESISSSCSTLWLNMPHHIIPPLCSCSRLSLRQWHGNGNRKDFASRWKFDGFCTLML